MTLWERFCHWLSQRVDLSDEDSRLLKLLMQAGGKENDACFFVMQSPSRIDVALLKGILKRQGFHCDPVSFPPHKITGILQAAGGVFCVRSWRGKEILWTDAVLYRRRLWNTLDDLIQGCRRHVVFVPFSIIAGRGPGPLFQPFRLHLDFPALPLNDLLRLASYLLYRRSLRCVFGPAVSSASKPNGPQLCRELVVRLSRHRRMARGVRPLPFRLQRQLVLSGSELAAEIASQSRMAGLPEQVVQRTALRALRKMAAGMHAWAVRAAYIILHPLVRRVFGEIEVANLEHVRRSFDAGPTVVVASHRTHFDYLILSYLFYFRLMPMPFIAAGENLDFWPIGTLLRSAGAFFIRRRIGDDRVYKVILANYLRMLLKQGALIEFFIEGGRSRSGALRPPRMGILKYLIDGWEKGDRQDITFVPAAVAYDCVPEEKSIISEFAGMRKERESIFSLFKLWGVWRKHFGAVRVVFGEPISVRKFSNALSEKMGRSADPRTIASALGVEIAEEIKHRTPLMVSGLGALAVMSFRVDAIGEQELAFRMSRLLWLYRFLRRSQTAYSEPDRLPAAEVEELQLAGMLRTDVTEQGVAQAMKQVVVRLVADGFLNSSDGKERGILRVEEAAALRLVFYRNSIFHHYLLPAVLAQSIYCRQSPFSASVGVLYDLLSGFFVLPAPLRWQELFAEFVHHAEKGGLGRPEALEPLRHLLLPFVESVYLTAAAISKCAASGVLEEELREKRRQLGAELWPDKVVAQAEICADYMFNYSLQFVQERGMVQVLHGAPGQGSGDENAEERTVVVQSPRKLDKLVRSLGEQLQR